MQNAIATVSFHDVTAGLTTINKKGATVSFERSIAFATKDARWELAAALYRSQCLSGRYTRLIQDSMAEGVLTKTQREMFEMMFGMGNPTKAQARMFCNVVLGLAQRAIDAGKPAKGKKQFLINMIGDLSNVLGKDEAIEASNAARTIEAATA